MNMLSFLGETPTIALRLAQDECGEEAIVISTKKISDARANGKNMYEVVVAIEDEDKKKNLIYTKSAISKASENSAQMKTHVYDFKEEILKMQGVLEQVQKSIWNPKSQLYDLTIPPEFASMYNTFELNEFDQEMTYTIMKKTIKQLPIALKI
jgi:flagellar biosynthesis protein FlhF